MLLANKPTIVRQAAATAGPEEEKIKKFATAIVEFSKVKKTKRYLQLDRAISNSQRKLKIVPNSWSSKSTIVND